MAGTLARWPTERDDEADSALERPQEQTETYHEVRAGEGYLSACGLVSSGKAMISFITTLVLEY